MEPSPWVTPRLHCPNGVQHHQARELVAHRAAAAQRPPSSRIGAISLTHAQFFKSHDAGMLFRTLAMLAFAVSFELMFWDGKHIYAVKTIALTVYRHF